MWLANDGLVFICHSHTYMKTHGTDKPDGKPVPCQRTFSSVFRAVSLHSYTAQLSLKGYGALYVAFYNVTVKLHRWPCICLPDDGLI